MAERIGKAKTFDELYQALDFLENITGSNGTVYSSNYLKNTIGALVNNVRRNCVMGSEAVEMSHAIEKMEDPTTLVTNTYGLRDKVKELLGEDLKERYPKSYEFSFAKKIKKVLKI